MQRQRQSEHRPHRPADGRQGRAWGCVGMGAVFALAAALGAAAGAELCDLAAACACGIGACIAGVITATGRP